MSAPQRIALLALALSPLLAGCPSESTEQSQQPVAPSAETPTEPSVLDEVEVIGVDEAAAEAEAEIDQANVLDELEALESEIGGDS